MSFEIANLQAVILQKYVSIIVREGTVKLPGAIQKRVVP